uniref:Lysyl oxidase homolog n=1 Tax=Oncorhynchus tshawytscha TaxID=74940 RepID=A0A8C8LVN0_ONCTS
MPSWCPLLCRLAMLLCVWAPCQAQSDTELPPGTPIIQLRLAGDKRKHYEGRVEVYYNGEWGTVCDDDFSIHAANILCRELGFVEAVSWSPSSKYGKGEGRIWLDNVHCSGRERTLAQCKSNGFGVSDCKHSEDVGVVCNQRRIPGFKFISSFTNSVESLNVQIEEVRIRAIYSQRKRVPITEGYLEVKDGGKWRQICDEEWTEMNNRVICGMYGFPGEKGYNTKVYNLVLRLLAKRRKKNYWDFGVNCTGNEASLHGCKLGHKVELKGNATCEKGMPVVVSCVPGRAFAPSYTQGFSKAYRVEQPLVRLRGGANTGDGRVEVLKNGEWGTVCDDSWNLKAASVVCRELGFGSAKEALAGGRLGQGMGPVHMNEVECSGFEKSLTECYFNRDALGCSHEEDAAVRCNVPAMGFQNKLRLSGGRNPFEGRVEVLAEKNDSLVWGTVCSDSWGTMEATVVCRQLGLGFASNAFQETWYWPGDVRADDVVMSGVRCSGTEMTLAQCLHHGKHLHCPRGGGRFAAGVSCSESAPDLVLNAQVVEHTTYLEDRPMYILQCANEEHCLSSSAATATPSSYRRLMRFSSQIHNNGQSDFRPRAAHNSWVWHDCHRHYHSMEVFTHYDLLSLNGTKVAEGHKASFCLEDTQCEEGTEKRYECANFGQQGITVGCWDTYRHDIDCQWIDVTDVVPGDYIFQVVINPNYEVAESDYTNNIMKCRCRYDGHLIWTYNCHIGGSVSSESEESSFPGLLNNQLGHR